MKTDRLIFTHLHLAVSRVDDVHDSVEGERGLGDVGGDHALAEAVGRLLEDLGLQVRRQLRVDRQHRQARRVLRLTQTLLYLKRCVIFQLLLR